MYPSALVMSLALALAVPTLSAPVASENRILERDPQLSSFEGLPVNPGTDARPAAPSTIVAPFLGLPITIPPAQLTTTSAAPAPSATTGNSGFSFSPILPPTTTSATPFTSAVLRPFFGFPVGPAQPTAIAISRRSNKRRRDASDHVLSENRILARDPQLPFFEEGLPIHPETSPIPAAPSTIVAPLLGPGIALAPSLVRPVTTPFATTSAAPAPSVTTGNLGFSFSPILPQTTTSATPFTSAVLRPFFGFPVGPAKPTATAISRRSKKRHLDASD